MQKSFAVLFIGLLCLLSACSSVPNIYEYATTELGEPNLMVAADGTVWRRDEPNENGRANVELVDTLEPGTISTVVKKKNADDMALWEYTLLTADKELDWFKYPAAVDGEGNTWLLIQNTSTSYSALRCDPVDEINEEQTQEGFWLEITGFKQATWSPQVLCVVFHDDERALINPGFVGLEVLIDGQWYRTSVSYSETLETKFFDENGEFSAISPLYGGYYHDIPLPSGHYRLKAEADDYVEWQKYFDENRGIEYLDLIKRYTVLEFDMTYKNGKHEIRNAS